MSKIGVTIQSKGDYLEFRKFLGIFHRYASIRFGFNIPLDKLNEDVGDINIYNLYTNDEDFINNKKTYATSPFILQAIDFYNRFLLPKISR